MRRTFAIAAMFAFALPALAAAQDHHDEHKGQPSHPGGPPPSPHPSGQPHPQFKQVGPQHGQMGGPSNPKFKPVNPQHGQVGGPPPPHPPGPPGQMGGPPHPPGPPGVQFTYHGHEFNRYHAPHPFIYPPGWAYRQWGIGAILPPIFLVPDYYFMDWADLGLPPPPPGDQWVRYGPDLLLVDVSTGQVVDVIYNAFY